MSVLSFRLKRSGHRPALFGYRVFARSVDEIVAAFRRRVDRVLAKDRAGDPGAVVPYALIGHSLGGIVARLAAPDLPPGLEGMVLLAPPNHPPALAAALADNPVFRLFTRDAGRKLTDPDFFDRLPEPTVPTLVVAGTRGPRASWLPFEGEPNDGIVRVSEARLNGVPMVLVPGLHTFLMNRRDVFEAIERFLADPRAVGLDDGGSAERSSGARTPAREL